jgi:hypothetical protein
MPRECRWLELPKSGIGLGCLLISGGDTVEVDHNAVRPNDAAAPEFGEPGGGAAYGPGTAFLAFLGFAGGRS